MAILQKLGSLYRGTGAPCYGDWIPKYYVKATNKLLLNQVPLGARELCCLTFLAVEHLGGREAEKCSQHFPPIPPGVPWLLLGSSWVHCLSALVLAPWWSFSVIQMAPKLWGGRGRALNAWDLTDAQVHPGMRGLWLLNCQHTHYNHIFIGSSGVHL